MNKTSFKEIITYITKCLLKCVFIGWLLLYVVYLIPTDSMRENVRHDLIFFENVGNRYYFWPGLENSGLDYFTDGIMINQAIFGGTKDAFLNSFNTPYRVYGGASGIVNLRYAVDDFGEDSIGEVKNYPRYWHGYLIWMKPLLLIFDISDIYAIMSFFQVLLMTICSIVIYRRFEEKYENKYIRILKSLIFLGCIILYNPIASALCFQYASVYCITLMTLLAICRKESNYWHIMMFSGISVAYFDFFTVPIVALGIPALFIIEISEGSLFEHIKRMILVCTAWGIGYSIMWFSKWIIATVFTNTNVIREATEHVIYRMDGEVYDDIYIYSNTWDVIWKNLEPYLKAPYILCFAFFLIIILLPIFRSQYKVRLTKNKVKIPAFIIIGILPIVWYTLVKNHSAIHYWMTHRNIIVMLCSMGLIVSNCLENYGLNNSSRKTFELYHK